MSEKNPSHATVPLTGFACRVPRVTGGIPGMIHLSQATRDALTGSYQLTEGKGGSRDQYLADNNIHTFLIGTGPTPPIHRWMFSVHKSFQLIAGHLRGFLLIFDFLIRYLIVDGQRGDRFI
jgi:hypothetical protein